jgi:hypothetical protein
MSLFRGERPTLSKLRFDAIGAPTKSSTPEILQEGDMWKDAKQQSFQYVVGGQQVGGIYQVSSNITPVTATNPNPTGNLMSVALPAGYLNAVGKTLYVWAAGLYTTAAAQTPTVTISVTIGGVTMISCVSQATTASQTNFPWNFEGFITMAAGGTTANAEAHGILDILLGGTSTAPVSAYNDTSTAVSSNFDSTVAQTLQVVAAMSSSNAGNNVVQRQIQLAVLN